MLFIATDMANAIIIFSKHISPLMVEEAFAIPIYSINIGTPFEKIIIAILMPMPSSPHTTIRGMIPKVRLI